MKENISPEEKLLRLIRGQKKSPPPAAAPASAIESIAPNARSAVKKRGFSFPGGKNKFALPDKRKILLGSLIFSCLLLTLSLVYPLFGLRVNVPDVKPGKNDDSQQQPRVEIKPFDYYLQGTQGRQIFGSAASGGQAAGGSVNSDLMKDISLVGVMAGDNPQAVLEDKKAQKTYYLSKGQSINNLVVADIQEGKIILDDNGQRYELHL